MNQHSASSPLPYAQPSAPSPAGQPYDHTRQTSKPNSGMGGPGEAVGNAGEAAGWSQQPQGAPGGYPTGYAPSHGYGRHPQGGPNQAGQPYSPQQGAFSPAQPSSAFPPAQHAYTAPTRSPSQPLSSSQPHLHSFSPALLQSPSSQPQPPFDPAALAALQANQAHHRSLVAYYWTYAQQGFTAPLTAPLGTEERGRQEAARREAVEWAKQCGFAVQPAVDETAAAAVLVTTAVSRSPLPEVPRERERTTSRPLPVAPSGAAVPPPIPLIRTMNATAGLGQAASLTSPSSPSSASPTNLARSPSDATPRPLPSTSPALFATLNSGKRPLPVPPVARSPLPPSPVDQLAQAVSTVSIVARAPTPLSPRAPSPAPAPAPSIPALAINDEPPSVPSFSFPDDDDSSTPAIVVPSFSFGEPADPPAASSSASSSSRRQLPPTPAPKQRLHPRHDPSHPSHHLYHPTSVSSPLGVSSFSTSISSTSSSRNTLAAEAGSLLCASCRTPIYGRVLNALDRAWHPACFVCAEEGCGSRLEVMEFEGTPEDWDQQDEGEEEEKKEEEGSEEEGSGSEEADSSEEEEGWVKTPRTRGRRSRVRVQKESLRDKAWCMVHFEERFALHCHHCHTPIASADYLPITDHLLPPLPQPSSTSSGNKTTKKSSTRYYHPLHFFCSGCGDPFIDPVQYESSLHAHPSSSPPAELEVKPYYARESHPYCGDCDLRMWRPKCPGCRRGVREEEGFLEVPVGGGTGGEDEGETRKWHEGCFKCSRCTRPLLSLYLLRLQTVLVPRTRKQGGGFEEVQEERPYCAECYDVVAAEEARAASEVGVH